MVFPQAFRHAAPLAVPETMRSQSTLLAWAPLYTTHIPHLCANETSFWREVVGPVKHN